MRCRTSGRIFSSRIRPAGWAERRCAAARRLRAPTDAFRRLRNRGPQRVDDAQLVSDGAVLGDDQAHLIGEFRMFTGRSPARFLAHPSSRRALVHGAQPTPRT